MRRPHDDGAIAGRAGVRLGTARDVTNGEVSSPRTGLGTWHRGQTLHPQRDMPSAVGTLRASPGHETDSSPLLSAAAPAPPRRFRPWTVDHTARSMGIDCSGPEPTRGLSHRTIPATHARPHPAPSNSSSPGPPAQLPQRNLPPPKTQVPAAAYSSCRDLLPAQGRSAQHPGLTRAHSTWSGTQMRPISCTACFSSRSSAAEASILAREKSSISRPWTIFHSPFSLTAGKEEMMPSGTP